MDTETRQTGPIEYVVALVGGSALPAYLAPLQLRAPKVRLLCTPDSQPTANLVADALREDGRCDVEIPVANLSATDYASNRHSIAGQLQEVPDAVLVYTGGTKPMAVAAELAWHEVRDRHRDEINAARHPLHMNAAGTDLALTNELGETHTIDVQPSLARILSLHLYDLQSCEAPERVGNLLEHNGVRVQRGRKQNGQKEFVRVLQANSRLTFVRRPHREQINVDNGVERQEVKRADVKLTAMQVAHEARLLGGEYARGAVVTQFDPDKHENLNRDLGLGWHSPTPPRVVTDTPEGWEQLRRIAAGPAAQLDAD